MCGRTQGTSDHNQSFLNFTFKYFKFSSCACIIVHSISFNRLKLTYRFCCQGIAAVMLIIWASLESNWCNFLDLNLWYAVSVTYTSLISNKGRHLSSGQNSNVKNKTWTVLLNFGKSDVRCWKSKKKVALNLKWNTYVSHLNTDRRQTMNYIAVRHTNKQGGILISPFLLYIELSVAVLQQLMQDCIWSHILFSKYFKSTWKQRKHRAPMMFTSYLYWISLNISSSLGLLNG